MGCGASSRDANSGNVKEPSAKSEKKEQGKTELKGIL